MTARLAAEFLGTAWLVLGGCGAAVLAASFGVNGSELGIGLLGVSLAFGLAVVTMAAALGPVSGCHLNPAVTAGLIAAGRHRLADGLPYMAAQTAGAIAGATLLYAIATGKPGVELGSFASNGFAQLSPGGYGLEAAALCETVLTFFFLLVILGATSARAPAAIAPVAIGLALTLIHLVSIPVTNTSVNPARSTGVALFAQTAALEQLWLFWAAPLLGGITGGLVYRWIFEARPEGTRAVLRAPHGPAPAAAR